MDESILEIYKEDIARFRVLLAGDDEEESFEIDQRQQGSKTESTSSTQLNRLQMEPSLLWNQRQWKTTFED
ncbi:MAG: hypothetical protein R2769_00220 [Saprospiraceae bacterium]